MKVSAWGNYPEIDADVIKLKDITQLKKIVDEKIPFIPMGMGRSYGDQALGKKIVSTLEYNCFSSFDEKNGILDCQCGVTLEEILDIFVPQGWFLPVTPGTKYVTLGGAIASDVHGKNHHKDGTFCDHVISFQMMIPSGEVKNCSKKDNPELFKATCGGNGLTGVILTAKIRLCPVKSAYIKQRSIRAKNIDELINLLQKNEDYTYSVAWIDCVSKGDKLGRGVLLLGEHAEEEELNSKQRKDPLVLKSGGNLNIPLNFPNFALNKLSIKIFNWLYYHKSKKGKSDSIIDYNSFFYPLDAIDNWNRIYGRRGFTQYQFVIPIEAGLDGVKKIIKKISDNGKGSFLAVLKIFGESNENYLSFPEKGYTLALDFSMNKKLFPFFEELDKMVLGMGGRLYATKDVRMSSEMFSKSYKEIDKFKRVRKKIGADKIFRSLQSERMEL